MTSQDTKNDNQSSAEDFQEPSVNSPQKLSLEQAFQLALQKFQAGNLLEAEQFCQKMLLVDPANPDINHLLGVIFTKQGGKEESALHFIQKALSINPNFADAYSNLGVVLRRLGKLDEAIASYKKAVSLNPENAKLYNNLGNALQESGNLDEACDSYRQALSLDPDNAKAYNNLGVVLQKLDLDDEAVASYEKAISLNPGYADAYNNLGYLYHESESTGEAYDSFNKAILLNPHYAEAYNNLGRTLMKMDRVDEAIDNFTKSLAINPDFAEAYNNLGVAFKESEKTAEAIASFKKAVSIKPLYFEAHNNLGLVFFKLDRFFDSEASFREAIAINPEYAEAYSNLGLVCGFMVVPDEAISCLKKALQLNDGLTKAYSNLLFIMNYQPHITQQEIFEESLNFAKKHETKEAVYSHLSAGRDLSTRKLRIGYVSPDFRTHSVSFFIKPLLEAHNREEFEIYCYSDVKNPDIVTGQIEAVTDHWVSMTKKDDEEAIAHINEDRIDILVDLAGHTGNNRLPMFARKPAPIQVSWLGYPNTTGLQAMDYRFVDIITDPVDRDDGFYSEKLVRLKDCFLCYQPNDHAPDVMAPPFVKNNTITFGSFNNLVKINSDVIKVWSRILLEVPGSRLVLKTKQLAAEHVREKYRAKFAEEGISSDRLELKGMIPNINDHLSLYNEIDIALDPFPYNGTTTTCEALWMGVPVVTLEGDRHGGRVGASILHAIGRAETLVADSSESYIKRAVSLAGEKDLLIGLRENLRQQMQDSPLCDANSFAKKIEEAYQGMWAKYLESHVKENSQK